MSDDRFTKLFKYMQEEFAAIRAEQTKMHGTVQQVYNTVDQVLKNQETDQQERLATNHQLDRHEAWIEQAADTIDVSYDPAA